jgi:hypothetical protein
MGRKLLILFSVVLTLGVAPSWALPANLDPAAAINKAGRQRMLSQRIAKAYCQLSLGILPASARTQLDESIALFDSQLAELTGFVADAETRTATANLARIWGPFRSRATGPVSREGCNELASVSEALLQAAHRLTALIQARVASDLGRLVNISGRQRMLTQKLTLLYMADMAGANSAQVRSKGDIAAAEFQAGLEQLRHAAGNTPTIRREIEEIALAWEWFRAALELHGKDSYGELVASASESILRSLETITGEYEALLRG